MRRTTMGFPVAILASIIILTACSSPSRESTSGNSWQQDCGAFAHDVTDLSSKTSGKNAGDLSDQFENKEVLWNLNFKGIKQEPRTGDTLDFDLEPCGIRQHFFSGKPVFMVFKPAAGTLETWKTSTTGSPVKISAEVSSVHFITISSGGDPDKQVPGALVSLENVRRVRD
jgi:hypothetical protein